MRVKIHFLGSVVEQHGCLLTRSSSQYKHLLLSNENTTAIRSSNFIQLKTYRTCISYSISCREIPLKRRAFNARQNLPLTTNTNRFIFNFTAMNHRKECDLVFSWISKYFFFLFHRLHVKGKKKIQSIHQNEAPLHSEWESDALRLLIWRFISHLCRRPSPFKACLCTLDQ